MPDFLKWLSGRPLRRRQSLRKRRTPAFESLESRALLSAVTLAVDSDTHLTNFQNQEANLGGRDQLQFLRGLYDGGQTALYRPLLQADLSGLTAAAADIDSAFLELHHSSGLFENLAMDVRVVALSRPWTEGTGQLNDRPGDGASWLHSETGTDWAEPGGDFNLTYDFGNGPDGVIVQATIPSFTASEWLSFDVTPIVQAWQSGALPNYGVAFLIDTGLFTEHQFESSEAADATLRPRLVVNVADAPTPPPPRNHGLNGLDNGHRNDSSHRRNGNDDGDHERDDHNVPRQSSPRDSGNDRHSDAPKRSEHDNKRRDRHDNGANNDDHRESLEFALPVRSNAGFRNDDDSLRGSRH